MDREISTWFNQEAWTGRCTSRRVGQSPSSRSIDAWPRWELPLSTTQNTRMAEAHGSLSISCSTSRPNGAMPVVAWQRPNSRAAATHRVGTATRHYQPATIDHGCIAPVSASRGEVQAWGTSAGWLRMSVVDELGGYRWLGSNPAPPLTRRVPLLVLAGCRVAGIEPVSRCRARIEHRGTT
jgi:hypothetical protein